MDEISAEKFAHIEKRLDQHGDRLNAHSEKIDRIDLNNVRSEEAMKALNATLTELKDQMISALNTFKDSLKELQSTFASKQDLKLSEQELNSKLNAQVVDGKWKGIVFGMVGCVVSFVIIAFVGSLIN